MINLNLPLNFFLKESAFCLKVGFHTTLFKNIICGLSKVAALNATLFSIFYIFNKKKNENIDSKINTYLRELESC
jgi:hypothetical protein